MYPSMSLNPLPKKWTDLKMSVYWENDGECINIDMDCDGGNAGIHIHSGDGDLAELVRMFKRAAAQLPDLKEEGKNGITSEG